MGKYLPKMGNVRENNECRTVYSPSQADKIDYILGYISSDSFVNKCHFTSVLKKKKK